MKAKPLPFQFHSSPNATDREAPRRVDNVIRPILVAPSHDACLAYVRGHHPDRTPPTETECRLEQLSARYARPGSRCC